MNSKRIRPMTAAVIDFLESHKGFFTYLELAQRLNPNSKGGRGIGACMRAIDRLGFSWLCRRVRKKG
jgi:hypothetical protein